MLRSLLFFCLLGVATAAENPDWTTPLEPFQIADHLYYVGSRDLASYLVTTSEGHFLINANLESSPPLLRASVEKLGFDWGDIKVLLNSQAHFDHVAGAARVLRETHAQDSVSPRGPYLLSRHRRRLSPHLCRNAGLSVRHLSGSSRDVFWHAGQAETASVRGSARLGRSGWLPEVAGKDAPGL